MTDSQYIQKELRNEIRERKNVGYSAKNRICGSKTKRRATLPSDSLTPKQWEEKNGQVVTYNMAAPMSWKDFSAMPQDIQKQYIGKLKDDYSVSGAILARSFGVSYATIMRRVQLLGMENRFSRKLKMTKENENQFHVFWNQGKETEDEPAIAVSEDLPAECADAPLEVEPMPIESPTPCYGGTMALAESSFTFRGPFNPVQITNTLRMILENGVLANITIQCSPV